MGIIRGLLPAGGEAVRQAVQPSGERRVCVCLCVCGVE